MFAFAYSPIYLYYPNDTKLGVDLNVDSFDNTSTPPLLTTAMTYLDEPKSIPTAQFINAGYLFIYYLWI